MGYASFSQAVAQVSDLSQRYDEASWRAVETLERVILDHRPTSAMEAVAMLDMVISDVIGGGRADGRDIKALQAIRAMLDDWSSET